MVAQCGEATKAAWGRGSRASRTTRAPGDAGRDRVHRAQRFRSRVGYRARCGGAVEGPPRQPAPLVVAADGARHAPARRGLMRRKKGGGRCHKADVRVAAPRRNVANADGVERCACLWRRPSGPSVAGRVSGLWGAPASMVVRGGEGDASIVVVRCGRSMPRSLLFHFPHLRTYLTIDRSHDRLFVLYVNMANHYPLTPELRASLRPVTRVLQREHVASEYRPPEHQNIAPIESYRASSVLHAHTALLLFSPDSYSTLLRLSGTTPPLFSLTRAPQFWMTDPLILSTDRELVTATARAEQGAREEQGARAEQGRERCARGWWCRW
ncbi:hypothetical protein DFH08DRAFT_1024799 [Mycena albidolilacea]|uniref:Uncharacterized protein n=1 Tax=Mycena albidolilacea TaxID=1033008 RepID=A0AAD7ALU8_9AGAR|nr:hypothetical protein DFH08DRAFT_1024799 [Mycena albidolilacea]